MSGQSLRKQLLMGVLFLPVLLASPLAGVALAGEDPLPYLRFPPLSDEAANASFSWFIFLPMLLISAMAVWPFVKRLARGRWKPKPEPGPDRPFPIWGWPAVAGIVLFWGIAWTRFPIMEPVQRFTFFPLWFCMIAAINAVAVRLYGRSLMTDRSRYFVLLFPASAVFWWIFEFLNRFVNNWHYADVAEIGGLQYFLESSLSFSTVLPAVLSVRFLLLGIPAFSEELNDFPALPWLKSRRLWSVLGVLSTVALAGLGWRPEFTYPVLWIAPGLLWIAFQKWQGSVDPMVRDASRGNLVLLGASAAAALCCGFFWEMWNMYSEAKWYYTIPGVSRFQLFEMPLLGYAGYLPFGVLCALAGHWLLDLLPGDNRFVEGQIEI